MYKVDILREQGNKCFKNKDYAKAIQFYKEGLELNPGNYILNNNIAQAFLANKNYSEAETHAVVSVALEEKSVKGYYRAAKAAIHQNKKDRALSYVKKGLSVCPSSDDLKTLLEQLRGNKSGLTNGYPERKAEKVNSGMKNTTKDGVKKDRSRSISNSRRLSGSSSADVTNTDNKRSTSSSRLDNAENDLKTKKNVKGTRGPIEIEDIQDDKVLKRVENILGDQKITTLIPEKRDSFENIRKDLLSFMKDGSEALKRGLSPKASEKYKSAVDIILIHNFTIFGLNEIDYVVLKYSLSISYIETANYGDIVKSLDYLNNIEERHSPKLPAVYYALGNAYYKLNRFRVALEHLGRGMTFIEKGFKITPHPWPGTLDTIKETTKSGLEESLEYLIQECKTYQEPDAVCRYENCLDISTHIIPSELIFYSDPDYNGYIVVICEASCRVTFHINCWKAVKEANAQYGKFTDKDMLGQKCFTSDCVNEINESSIIVKIEIYGDNGNLKSSCSKEPIRPVSNIIKENKKVKKKKDYKIMGKTKQVKREKKRNSNTDQKVSSTNTRDILVKLTKLNTLRDLNFGCKPETTFSPSAEYFGKSDLASLEKFLTPEYIDDSEEIRNAKEFIFTFFFEFIKNEGPQKIKDIEEKWANEASLFPGVTEFISENEGICSFLLRSYRFAAIDDYVCVASQLPIAYDLIESKLSEGLSVRLGTKSDILPLVTEETSTEKTPDHSILENQVSHLDEPPTLSEPLPSISEDDEDNDEGEIDKFHDALNGMIYVSETSDSESEEGSEDEDEEEEEQEIEEGRLEIEGDEEEGGDDLVEEGQEVEEERGENYHLDKSDLSINIHLNPTAQENLPSGAQAIAVEKLYDKLNQEGVTDHNGIDEKNRFVKLFTNIFNSSDPEFCNLALNNTTDSDIIQMDSDINQTNSDIATPKAAPVLSVETETQTEPGRNFDKELEEMTVVVKELQTTLEEKTKFYDKLQQKYTNDTERLQKTLKEREIEISTAETERLKQIKTHQAEISKKDSKMDSLKKQHNEQIDKLNKKLEQEDKAHKDLESKAQEFTILIASLKSDLEQEKLQGKKILNELLDTKKALGEHKINQYLDNCTKKLEIMNFMLKYLTENDKPTLSEVKNAIKEWESVKKQAEMILAQFQIQYAVLTKDLEKTGSLSNSKNLIVTDLPTVPPYPIEDMEILQKALEKRNVSSPTNGPGGDAGIMESPHVNTSNARISAPLVLNPYNYPQLAQGQNIYMSSTSTMYPSQSYQTGSFGGALFRMPPASVIPAPLPNALPLPGFLSKAGATVFREQQEHPSMPNRNGSTDSLKTFGTESTSRKANVTSSISAKLEPVQKSLNEKKKLSAAAGLAPIEIKNGPTPSDTMKKPGAVPKKLASNFSDSRNNSSGSASVKTWKYEKLLSSLKTYFQTENEDELGVCLAIARERNNNSLSGLPVPVIHEMVAKVLQERSDAKINSGSMAMDKFGGCPWRQVKESDFEWDKPVEESEECIICHIQMTSGVTALLCKHSFHTECIRKWLKTNSTCPMCRKYTTLNDEFPPLT